MTHHSWYYDELPFGKHAHKPIGEIPGSYLEWLLKQHWFIEEFEYLAESVRACLDSKRQSNRRPESKASANSITTDIVKRWHRTLVLKFHPDRDGGSHQAMCAINHAHELLQQMVGGAA